MLSVGVLIMVIVDLLVLIVFTAVVSGLNLPLVQLVPHREKPQTVTGVSRNNNKNKFGDSFVPGHVFTTISMLHTEKWGQFRR